MVLGRYRSTAESVEPGVRFLGVVRQWDRTLICSHRHGANGRGLQDQQSLVHKVLGAHASETHLRLTVTDRDHGSLHYDSDRE
jgi:hypothetical protein